MKRLQSYGLAVAGSILAILVTPGNLIGLPIGIWALVVLSQRQVREAFGKGHAMPRLEPARATNGGGAWKVTAVIVAAVMLVLAIPVGAILLALWVPAFSRARDRARVVQEQIRQPAPTFVIRGTVTDAVTGKPIAGAQVGDDAYFTRYGAFPNRPAQQARSDEQGHYELRTWYEEHTLTASAPGYQTKLQPLYPANFQQGQPALIDFQLQPAQTNSPEVLVPAEKLSAYTFAATKLEDLKMQERELLLQYTESFPLVRDVRERIGKLTRQKADLERQYPALTDHLSGPGNERTSSVGTDVLIARVNTMGTLLSNLQAQASHVISVPGKTNDSLQKQIAKVQEELRDAQRELLERKAAVLDNQLQLQLQPAERGPAAR
jgi:hypothetical protein